MKLEVGKCYMTRDGRKSGPVELDGGSNSYPCKAYIDGSGWQSFTANGAWNVTCCGHHLDLIAEWTDEPAAPQPAGPVRTITRKEIVPGVYGQVVVCDEGNSCRVRYMRDAATIRAAIATLSEIADAMEENSK